MLNSDLQQNPQLYRGKNFLLALSGGRDSVALFHHLLSHRLNFRACHVNHQWSGQAEQWTDFCRRLCAGHAVEFIEEILPPPSGKNSEAEARAGRYGALARLLRPGEILLTGHQRDDQRETFFLQLLRGAGLDGLAAMPLRKPFGAGEHWRPLLPCSREAISAYCLEHGLAYIDDPSNDSERYARNRLRLTVLPALAQHYGHFDRALDRSVAHLGEALQLQQYFLDKLLPGAVFPWDEIQARENGLVAKALLRRWLQRRQLILGEQRLAAFLASLGGAGLPQLCQAGKIILYYQGLIHVYDQAEPAPPPPFRPLTHWPGLGTLRVERAPADRELRWGLYPLRANFQRPGQRYASNLKNFFQNQGINPIDRRRRPLLVAGNECLWIGGCGNHKNYPELQVFWQGAPENSELFS